MWRWSGPTAEAARQRVRGRAQDRLRVAAADPAVHASILQAMALTEEPDALPADDWAEAAGWTALWAGGPRSAWHLRLTGPTGPMPAVVWFEAGGRQIVAGACADHTVRLWDPEDGTPLTVLIGHDGPVTALAVGAVAGRATLASLASDGTARLWDPVTGAALHTLDAGPGKPTDLVFMPDVDGRTVLLTATSTVHPVNGPWQDGGVRRWDAATGADLGALHEDCNNVSGLATAPGVLVEMGHELHARDPATGELLTTWEWNNTWPDHDYDQAAFEPPIVVSTRAGRVVVGSAAHAACGGASLDYQCGALVWWDAETRDEVHRERLERDEFLLAATTVDGRGRRATVTVDRAEPTITVAGEDGAPIVVLRGHRGSVRAAAFGAVVGRTALATAGADGTVRVWDTDAPPAEHHRRSGTGLAVVAAPSGPVLALTQHGASADLLDARTGTRAGNLHCDPDPGSVGHRCDTYTMRGVVDHNTQCVVGLTVRGRPVLATGGTAGGVPLWNPATGDVVRVIGYRSGAGVLAAGEVDGRPVLATGGAGLAVLWDPATGKRLTGLRDGEDLGAWSATAMTFATAAGQPVVATGGAMHVDVWDAATGRHRYRLPGHGYRSGSGLAAGIETLATVRDDQIRLWDTASGRPLRTLQSPDGVLTCLAGIAVGDRELLVSGAADGTVRLWDPATGGILGVLATFARPVGAVTAAHLDGGPHVFALATSGRVTACRLEQSLLG
jgi:WD40 repeat protein